MKINEVVNALEQFAPLPLQADYDNAGLQIGLTEADISGALLCLDVTEEIVNEAVERGCNLIVAHHPLIFHKLRRITAEDYVQRTVMLAIKKGVAIMAMHTNLDSVAGGVNHRMAQKLKLEELKPIGKLQSIDCPSHDECCPTHTVKGSEGLMGTLPEPLAADDFVMLLKDVFGVECVMANQLLRRPIGKVALCGGAGDFLLDEAIAQGADAFVTGEMHYHQYFGHEQDIQIAVIGHYQSERFTPEILKEVIEARFPDVPCHIAETNTNPILYL